MSRETDYLRKVERKADRVREVPSPDWTTYTPTVTASSGTFTTVSATGNYSVVGHVAHVNMEITITTKGTAGGFLFATLPFTATGAAVGCGRENAVTGHQLQGLVDSGLARVTILRYDGTTVIVDGYVLKLSVTFPI